jgi:4-carboxymuconolactone decarboxylase
MKSWFTAMTSFALGVGTLAMVASMSERSVVGKEPRFVQLRMEDLNKQQRPLAEEIMRISSVGIIGPYHALLRSPVMVERMFKLLDYLRFNTSVPRKLNEFAILIVARQWTSQVEWCAHHPLAIKARLSEAVAADLKEGKRPAAMQPDEAATYDFLIERSTRHEVSDATFNQLRGFLSEQQIAEQGVPADKTPPLAPLDPQVV